MQIGDLWPAGDANSTPARECGKRRFRRLLDTPHRCFKHMALFDLRRHNTETGSHPGHALVAPSVEPRMIRRRSLMRKSAAVTSTRPRCSARPAGCLGLMAVGDLDTFIHFDSRHATGHVLEWRSMTGDRPVSDHFQRPPLRTKGTHACVALFLRNPFWGF